MTTSPISTCIPAILLTLTIVLGNSGRTSASQNNSVPWTTADGNTLVSLETEMVIGIEDGDPMLMFGRVSDVSVDGRGNVYVADLGFDNVRVFSPSGMFLRTIGRSGPGPGEFTSPTALAVSSNGDVLIADPQRLHLFNAEGVSVNSFNHGAGGRLVRSVAFDADGNLLATWFDVWDPSIVHRYSRDGQALDSFSESWAFGQDIDLREERQFAGGYIDVDAEGHRILYSQLYPFELRVFNTAGTLEEVYSDRLKDFDEEPLFETDGDGFSAGLRTRSLGAFYLPDGNIFHSTFKAEFVEPPETQTLIEVFDSKGAPLATGITDDEILVRCGDQEGKVYGTVNLPFPQIRRFAVRIKDGGQTSP